MTFHTFSKLFSLAGIQLQIRSKVGKYFFCKDIIDTTCSSPICLDLPTFLFGSSYRVSKELLMVCWILLEVIDDEPGPVRIFLPGDGDFGCVLDFLCVLVPAP